MNAEQIKALIASNLSCTHLELQGDGRHWYAVVVAAEFDGKRAIARHQRVYAALAGKVESGEVHALSIKAFTPAEWAAQAA